jgi:hypothetical protein
MSTEQKDALMVADMREMLRLRAMQTQECVECNRVFDMDIDIDANEWQYGHDCEV